MTKLYKLTDENDQTHGGCQWAENVEVRTSGKGELCRSGWTHWYTDPLLAVLLNPIHGRFDLATAHLWEGEGEVGADDGLKVGCTVARTIRRVPLPAVTSEQRVRFGIGCAWIVWPGDRWRAWARGWLRAADRTSAAAWAAAWAAEAEAAEAARAAAWAEAWAEAWAADAAARAAAWAAARAAEAEAVDLPAIAAWAMSDSVDPEAKETPDD